jgi:hypothetical protein
MGARLYGRLNLRGDKGEFSSKGEEVSKKLLDVSFIAILILLASMNPDATLGVCDYISFS